MVIPTGPDWCCVNIGLGNSLVPDGTKPLPEPMLPKRYDAISVLKIQIFITV